jgi:RNA polymerase sigma-70 factor (ECF subfamily)
VNAGEFSPHPMPPVDEVPSEDASLVERLRHGDAAAGYLFFRDHYPRIYRYLLWLTGHPEAAEDLAQETFLRAWRYLDTFDARGCLQVWLHGIARREFMRARRRDPAPASLEEVGDVAAPGSSGEIASLELHEALRKLPEEQREAIILHYLEGYSSVEIARIVGAPEGTVRYRLSQARERLRRALGEGDLAYLNEPLAPMHQWNWLPLDQMHALEARVSLERKASKEEAMERREFLRQAAVGAAGLMLPDADKEVIDGRLTQKVTLAFKGTALSDLCEHLRSETGVHIAAGASVTDEKVTLFCERMPLREVMRQLSRPFGYTWLRSTRNGAYHYELVQDMRSQLLEEELRNRDRHAALLALEREIERFRPYLDLSPDEALARSETAPPNEAEVLWKLAGYGWGPIQMYFRLSNQQLAALRAGQTLTFSEAPDPGQYPLPPELARGVLQSFRGFQIHDKVGWYGIYPPDPKHPDNRAPAAVPGLRVRVNVTLRQSELGEYILHGESRLFFPKGASHGEEGDPYYASGKSPAVLKPDNRAANLKLTSDPALGPRVSVQPQPSCHPAPTREPSDGSVPEPKVTTADVLEVLHKASGLPIVADYYTRLYPPSELSVRDLSLFESLNQLADRMRLRWRKDADGSWLEFRSASYYDDRLKEVPNRLLSRWSEARRQRGSLSLDEVLEIVQLSDTLLDGIEMAEGAQDCLGLAEWVLVRSKWLRPHLRYLATFTPEQRQMALRTEGIPFTRLTLAQQQQFIAFTTLYDEPPSWEDLQGASLRVDYCQPGGFQWGNPDIPWSWARWVVIVEHGREGHWAPRPAVRGRTPEEVMQAVLRLDPQIRERAVQTGPARPPRAPDPTPLEGQIFPTQLSLNIIYFPSAANKLLPRIVGHNADNRPVLY